MIFLRFRVGGKIHFGIQKNAAAKIQEIVPDYFSPYQLTGRTFYRSEIKLLAPALPSKIIALAFSYRQHRRELSYLKEARKEPAEPTIFLKAPSAVIGPQENIIYPPLASRVDYEAELAVVMKEKLSLVRADKKQIADFRRHWSRYILGYTAFNDVTARDLQKKDGQWSRAKSFDTFAPLGPVIVSGINPRSLHLRCYVNNKLKQSGTTRDLLFTIREILEFIASVMTLYPQDVIATGTPEGVGEIQPGDVVRVEIEKIGSLTNRVVKI